MLEGPFQALSFSPAVAARLVFDEKLDFMGYLIDMHSGAMPSANEGCAHFCAEARETPLVLRSFLWLKVCGFETARGKNVEWPKQKRSGTMGLCKSNLQALSLKLFVLLPAVVERNKRTHLVRTAPQRPGHPRFRTKLAAPICKFDQESSHLECLPKPTIPFITPCLSLQGRCRRKLPRGGGFPPNSALLVV